MMGSSPAGVFWAKIVGLVGAIGIFSAAMGPALGMDTAISELRFGIMAHSVDAQGGPDSQPDLTSWEDINFEILFRSPDLDVVRFIGSPRINLGVNFNTAGRESLARLGLTWQAPIFDSDFFVEGTLGGLVHDGAIDGVAYPLRQLGCRFLFYQSVGIGMNLGDDKTLTLALEHGSSGSLCEPNQGLTNLGLKIGFKF